MSLVNQNHGHRRPNFISRISRTTSAVVGVEAPPPCTEERHHSKIISTTISPLVALFFIYTLRTRRLYTSSYTCTYVSHQIDAAFSKQRSSTATRSEMVFGKTVWLALGYRFELVTVGESRPPSLRKSHSIRSRSKILHDAVMHCLTLKVEWIGVSSSA